MYTKCFSTLRCCGWAYGYTLLPYYMCRWGWILGKIGYSWACMMLRCRDWGCKPPMTASPNHIPYWMYTKCLSTLRCCGWAYGCILIAVLHVQVGVNFEGKWGMAEPVWCCGCGVMVEAANPQWLHPTSILDVYKVFEQLEMLWMGIWVHPSAILHVQVGVNFRQ